MNYEFYMQHALAQGRLAMQAGETPIGCVIEYHNQIIGWGHNLRNTKKNSLYHAEIIAIHQACGFMGDWRLEDCRLFVTIEPCPMCAGAILQSRIKEVVFGARNKKAGCAGSVLNILQEGAFNHQVLLTEGILLEDCAALMKRFFAELRENAKLNNVLLNNTQNLS